MPTCRSNGADDGQREYCRLQLLNWISHRKSTILTLVDTAKALGFMGFVLVSNPRFGDLAAEPLPFDIPGIIIPNVADVKVCIYNGSILYIIGISQSLN